MKFPNRISATIAGIAFTAIVGCAATPTQQSTGHYVDDSATTAKVKAAIFNEPSLASKEINVETYEGRVQLSGFVGTQSDIDSAVSLAQNVEGVKFVRNDMHLK